MTKLVSDNVKQYSLPTTKEKNYTNKGSTCGVLETRAFVMELSSKST